MDEELFVLKRNITILLVVGIILILFGGILGFLVTFIGLSVVTGTSIWLLYGLISRLGQIENSIRIRYEKIARRKGKRLVIVYNPEGQQFYPRQQTPGMPSPGYQSIDSKITYCPKCGSKVEPGYKFCMICRQN